SVLRKTDLTGPRRRISGLAIRRQRVFETAQRVIVELGPEEALVAGEAAAKHILHLHDFASATMHDTRKLVHDAHLANAAHRMNRHRAGLALDRDSRQERIVDELDAIVHR